MKVLMKKELASLLGVNESTITRWGSEKTKINALNKACIEIIKIEKVGRCVQYTCIYKIVTRSYEEDIQEIFKTKNTNDFIRYARMRIKNIEEDTIETRNELCLRANIPLSTSKRFDKLLVNKNIIKEVGQNYICMEKKTKKKVFVTKGEHTNFWLKGKTTKKGINVLNESLGRGEITKEQNKYLVDKLTDTTEWMYYKEKRYSLNRSNEITKLLLIN